MNQTTDQKIDCVVRVVTPENIEFEYLLAGPFQRLPAFLIDFALRSALLMAIVFAGAIVGVSLAGGVGFAVTWVLGFVGFFVLSWLYGTIMEAQFNGRTVGKILLGLRVISTDGRPINGSQAALRNLLRLSDLMPPLSLALFFPDAPPADIIPTFFIGLVAMTLTTRMQRIGDLAAGTMVVWDGRRGVSSNLQPEDARAFSLAELIPPTFQISRTLARSVGLYMERRRLLSPQRRQEIASNLAQPLFAQFDLRSDTSADLLLCALYVRIYHSEVQRAAKLESLRGKQFTPAMTMVSPAVNIQATGYLQPSVYALPPAHSHSTVLAQAAGRIQTLSMPAAPPIENIPPNYIQATPVTARPMAADEHPIVDAQTIEPGAEYFTAQGTPEPEFGKWPDAVPPTDQRGVQP